MAADHVDYTEPFEVGGYVMRVETADRQGGETLCRLRTWVRLHVHLSLTRDLVLNGHVGVLVSLGWVLAERHYCRVGDYSVLELSTTYFAQSELVDRLVRAQDMPGRLRSLELEPHAPNGDEL